MNTPTPLVLELAHTGERLEFRRVRAENGTEQFLLSGSLPPNREGPPLHVHTYEDEHGEVVSGTLHAIADGRQVLIPAGGAASFPKGCAHRWWNAGPDPLVFRGTVSPAVDLDRFLQALFEVQNAGRRGKPSLFYLAHVLHRHRHSQTALIMPPFVQRVLLPGIVMLGTLLGKYSGSNWPGCPDRCRGVALEG